MSHITLAIVALATACVSSLRLILDYRLRKLGVQAASAARQAASDLRLARLRLHRTVLARAAAEPQAAALYRELIIANALYLAVEQHGARLTDQAHRQLYGPRVSCRGGRPGGPAASPPGPVSPGQPAPARTPGSAWWSSAGIRRTAGMRRPHAPTIAPAHPRSPRGLS